ncbi:MAG: hypothetical protein IIC55_05025 [Proteobacteria bacterium]|nr:hypothetical protein [Pseudomonadota bacterium]
MNSVFHRSGRPSSRRGRGGLICAVFLAAAFLFAGAGPAEAAKHADLKGSTLELFKAVALNDMAGVKKSIDDGADLYAENEEGMSAADLAVDKGHFIVAHYLLSRRLAEQTPPVALVPGKAKEAQKAAKSRPKRKFAAPPPKPPAPPSMELAKPRAKPEKTPGETPETTPPDTGETVAEIPPAEAKDKPTETAAEAQETQVAPDAEETVAEAPDAPETPGKPLAWEGPVSFFESLVDLITPGGEKPPPKPEVTAKEADAKGTPGAEPGVAPGAEPGAELEETIVEEAVEQSDEIIVDVTGDDATAGDIVVEITDEPVVTLEETDLETVTIEPDLEDETKKEDEAKPEQPGESFLDRIAGLFTSDDKKDAMKGKPEEQGPARGAPAVSEIETYELPLPPPRITAPKKFPSKFLDKLADFLESGDEEAFKAWLPEMQVVNPAALSALGTQRPPAEPAEVAAKPEDAEPESVEMAAVEKAPLEPPPGALSGEDEKPMTAEDDKPAVAEASAQEPAREPDDKPGMIKGVFNKLVGILTPDFGDKDRSGRLVLEPDEKLAQAGKKDAAGGEQAPGEQAGGDKPPKYWPITEVKSAETPPLTARKPVRGSLLRTSLTGVTLSLGESVSLENSFPPAGAGIDPYNRCVKKNRGTTLFCLETVDWPEAMQPDFLVPTILYTGQKAIARYDQGIASRFHALFPSESFQRIAGYFHQRFGEPTDAWNRSIAPFAQPRQDNPTLAWRSIDPESQVITVLEIRKYDDSRGGFPDTKRGAVMLYLANAPPIFPQVSSHELMRLSRGTMGPPPAPGAAKGTPEAPPETEAEPEAEKPLSEMTSEEIQAERRKRKAKEAVEDSFELPPDPLGR